MLPLRRLSWGIVAATLALTSGCGSDPPGVLPGADGAATDGAATDNGGQCLATQIACGASCVAPATDPANCGTCGRRCGAGEFCMSGMCMGASPDGATTMPDAGPMSMGDGATMTLMDAVVQTCPGSLIRCGDACAEISTDRANCGGCGQACGAGQSCTSGVCVAAVMDSGVTPCSGAQLRCNNVCTDLSTSTAHCGGCNRPCGAGQVCNAGACMTLVMDSGVVACPGAQLRCNNVCTDLSTSAAHCGGCNRPCAAGQTCNAGVCLSPIVDAGVVDSGTACGGGTTRCNGACVNTSSNNSNCGGCGLACGTGTSCMGGACLPTCGSGEIVCGVTCANPSTDRNNCGACGRACAGGQVCSAGACVSTTMDAGVSCTGGQINCGGACINPATSQDHCGGCNNRCTGNTGCFSGTCQSTMMTPDVPPSGDGGGGGMDSGVVSCSGGQISCGGMCVNPATNQSHCGRCNNRCEGSTACVSGTCQSTMTSPDSGAPDTGVVTCSGGQITCGGMCVNPATNQSHCGRCNNPCVGSTACVSGNCQSTMTMGGDGGVMGDGGGGGMCATGQTQCSGVCRDLHFDASHCGACGRACPSGYYCDRGTCMNGNSMTDGGTGDGGGNTCATGQTLCSGVCRDLDFDASHCGACGRACPSGNYCDRGTCMGGVSDGGVPTDGGGDGGFGGGCVTCGGACIYIATDPLNCGGCGVRCGTGQLCILGACLTSTTCTMGTTRCGPICTDTTRDPRHCGGCNIACAGTQRCGMGTCR